VGAERRIGELRLIEFSKNLKRNIGHRKRKNLNNAASQAKVKTKKKDKVK